MANTINGMAVDEVRDKLKNLVSAEDWTIQDKTGYPYLKGAMLRGRLTDLLGLNLSINSLRNDWRVMNDNTIVAFATMELVIKDDMGNEVCRSSATGEATSSPRKESGAINYGSEITSAETDAIKAALQAWVIMEKPKGTKGCTQESYPEDLSFRVKVTQTPSILGSGVIKSACIVGKEERMLVFYESNYSSLLGGLSANDFAMKTFKPGTEYVVIGRENSYKGEKQILVSTLKSISSRNSTAAPNSGEKSNSQAVNFNSANTKTFKVTITDKGKLLDNGMVNVPISLEDESIDMVIYSKTVMAIVQKNKLPNPQSYAESFASLIGKTVSIKGSLKTFNGKRQLVYNK